MAKLTLSLSCLAVLSCAWAAPAGQGKLDCGKENMDPVQSDMIGNASMSCAASLNLNPKDVHVKDDDWMAEDFDDKCFSKCFASEMKWTNEKGQLSKEALLTVVSQAPPAASDALKLEISTCYTKFEKQLDSTDEAMSCKGFKNTRACLVKSLSKICSRR